MFDLKTISGIGDYEEKKFTPDEKDDKGGRKEEEIRTYSVPSGKVFLVDRLHTFELRSDPKLISLLTGKYESVMKSRYFGRGGIEIVRNADQLRKDELEDLVRLSYNLTKDLPND